jgi:hypothetical protein
MVLALFGMLLMGQGAGSADSQRTVATAPGSSIVLGSVSLRLGMSKSEVRDKLSDYGITELKENDWYIFADKLTDPPTTDPLGLGEVEFTNGHVSFISRSWLTRDTDVIDAIFGAVMSLKREGIRACSISADTVTDPQMRTERTWIQCGKKSLQIGKLHSDFGAHLQFVEEQMGQPDVK